MYLLLIQDEDSQEESQISSASSDQDEKQQGKRKAKKPHAPKPAKRPPRSGQRGMQHITYLQAHDQNWKWNTKPPLSRLLLTNSPIGRAFHRSWDPTPRGWWRWRLASALESGGHRRKRFIACLHDVWVAECWCECNDLFVQQVSATVCGRAPLRMKRAMVQSESANQYIIGMTMQKHMPSM